MDGLIYTIDQLGRALQQANQLIEQLQQRIAELEAQLTPEGEEPRG